MDGVWTDCVNCGHVIPDIHQHEGPCPLCGGSLQIHASMYETVPPWSDEWSAETVTDLNRSAAEKLRDAQHAMSELAALNTFLDPLRLREILHNTYKEVNGLLDACKAEVADDRLVSDLLKRDVDVARAHEMGNLAKHPKLKARPRRGGTPSFGEFTVGHAVGGGSITILDVVYFDDQPHSGLEICASAIASWESAMLRWGLLGELT